jgi:hypothetical protein
MASEPTTARGATAIAYRAMNRADAAFAEIESHEKLCAERYRVIEEKLGMITRLLAWAGSFLFLLIVGMLGWSLKIQIEAASTERRALENRIELIRQGIVPIQQSIERSAAPAPQTESR